MNPLDDDTSTRTGLWVVFSTVTILLISVIIWVLKGADGAMMSQPRPHPPRRLPRAQQAMAKAPAPRLRKPLPPLQPRTQPPPHRQKPSLKSSLPLSRTRPHNLQAPSTSSLPPLLFPLTPNRPSPPCRGPEGRRGPPCPAGWLSRSHRQHRLQPRSGQAPRPWRARCPHRTGHPRATHHLRKPEQTTGSGNNAEARRVEILLID